MRGEHDHGDYRAVRAFGCLLCERGERTPVASCKRCGAFVCREHVVRIVHSTPRRPVSLMSAAPRGTRRSFEMVCEVCYLDERASREEAV